MGPSAILAHTVHFLHILVSLSESAPDQVYGGVAFRFHLRVVEVIARRSILCHFFVSEVSVDLPDPEPLADVA